MRRAVIVLISVLGVAAAVVAVLVIYLSTANLAPLVERYSNTLIGRPIRLGSLHLGLGRNLHIAARDVQLPAIVDPKLPAWTPMCGFFRCSPATSWSSWSRSIIWR